MIIRPRPIARLSKAIRNINALRQFHTGEEPKPDLPQPRPRTAKAHILKHKVNIQGHSLLAGQRLRRSFLYVPAHNQRFIGKALKSAADCIVLDLEDGVAPQEKDNARKNIQKDLNKDLDIMALPEAINLTLVIPKANSPVDLRNIRKVVMHKRFRGKAPEPVESNFKRLPMIPIIETPYGVANLPKFQTFGGWFSAMVFAAEDYCASMGIPRTSDYSNMLYARSSMVNTCKMMGLTPIDMVCQDYKRGDVLKQECDEGVYLGFEGKQTIHPDQIDTINKVFAPQPEEVEWAREILAAVEANPGDGAFEFRGKMVDRPVFRKAESILLKQEKIEKSEEEKFLKEEEF
ncbi:hypothetical protein ABW20_dc0103505 [Dactylellina cionopaga]|nr:hypothetical protein ABW20_dc0103505 [Dactylellina cionopaga]